ncbi:hypothetical protein [Marinobacterium arenosum]|uniref:hypothetical protein n=1 Tax=Marinobacterium arenosum TaxID=2862496 RepID=UPI001C94C326|nr:hypothetical protein [Marinobacterium arenosum]MBY4677750.1 hypothetical protein [Marinobacterium arenosum]
MRKLLWMLALLSSSAMADYRSLADQPLSLEQQGWQHLVFVNIWDSYAGLGPETLVEQLPASFSQQVQRIWVAPDLNVTEAYLRDYQQAFPASKPLLIDHQYQLMRQYDLWQTPAHVLLKDGKVQFSGNGDELQHFIKRLF